MSRKIKPVLKNGKVDECWLRGILDELSDLRDQSQKWEDTKKKIADSVDTIKFPKIETVHNE